MAVERCGLIEMELFLWTGLGVEFGLEFGLELALQ